MVKKVTRGQPWKPPKASDANAIAMAADAHMRGTAPRLDRERPNAGTIVQIKNVSGSARRRGDVLAINRTLLVANVDRDYPWLEGDGLAAGNRNSILVVLLDPLADDEIGDAQLFGVAVVYVNVQQTWHRRAFPYGASTVRSGVFGPLEILNTPDDTGEQLLLCSVGHADNRGLIAKTTSSVAAATLTSGRLTLGTGTAKIHDPYTTLLQYSDSTHEFAAYNMDGEAVTNGSYVWVEPGDDWLPLVTPICVAPV